MQKTIADIKSHKHKDTPLVCLTSYTAPMTEILDAYCDLLLVGDSLGMVVYGMENTLGVSLEIMIAHGKAVASHAKQACVVVDMPYGSYEHSTNDALKNAQRIINETGAQAVKLEGGLEIVQTVKFLVQNGIPVISHIGLQPQSVIKEGGYKIKGKTQEDTDRLINEAKAHEQAGASAIVVEGTAESASKDISASISIPTIGIGAGRHCDGQILVIDDLLGMLSMPAPKFAKRYADLKTNISKACATYAQDVRSGNFPTPAHIYQPIEKKALQHTQGKKSA